MTNALFYRLDIKADSWAVNSKPLRLQICYREDAFGLYPLLIHSSTLGVMRTQIVQKIVKKADANVGRKEPG